MLHQWKRYSAPIALALCRVTNPAQAQAQSGPAEAPNGLEEIVVTAQRRQQSEQSVPISISTISAEMLNRTNTISTEDLTEITPSLVFSRQIANGGAPFIRGVGTGTANAGTSSPVGTYIDDVYIGAPAGTSTLLNNIDQVEVLKGPQGTLFGRNATGGVINIQTRKPDFRPSVDASFGYGNYDTTEGHVYATDGLTDILAMNFAGVYHDQADGYGHDIRTGTSIYHSRDQAARVEALLKPSDSTRLLFTVDAANEQGDEGLNATIWPGSVAVAGQTYPGRYNASEVPPDWDKMDQYGMSARLDQDLSWARFVSISSYRHVRNNFRIDVVGSGTNILDNFIYSQTNTKSQEFQLQAPESSSVQWIVGAYYYHENADYDPFQSVGTSQKANGGSVSLDAVQALNSFAGFADATYEILPALKSTTGIRYTVDEFNFNANKVNAAGAVLPGYPLSQKDNFPKTTYREIFAYQFTADIMSYASYSRGFKSGGYNVSAPIIVVGGVPVAAPPIEPEVLDAYEIGLKSEFFEHRLRFNPSAFYYKYDNMQVTTVGPGYATILNAASSHIKGVDLDFEALPVDRVRISGGVEYLDGRFSSFPSGPYLTPNPASCTPSPHTIGPLTGGDTTCQANLAGLHTPRSPAFTGSLLVDYTIPIAVGSLDVSGSLYRNSGYTWDPDNRLKQPAYYLLGANLGWKSPDGHYQASLWGHNLTDSFYYSYASAAAFRDSGSPAPPRTYGISVGVHF